ncbi:MAG: TIR domain-containing protein [Planctomycetia bacterium]|nr:TIR domain-containing protein [Planctomycetia bacterium]
MQSEEGPLKGRVLIVENDRGIEWCLDKQLVGAGHTVIGIAGSVTGAVNAARQDLPDVVIMDIRIPQEDGGSPDLSNGGIQAAKQIESLGDVGVIYLTGAQADGKLLSRVLKDTPGATFLTKPCLEEQVLAAIQLTLMRRKGMRVVFVCYAHKDKSYKAELLSYLSSVKSLGVDSWDDEKISYGGRWKVQISAALKRADVAILLVSIHFMNSVFIKEVELPTLLKAEEERGIKIIPVFVGTVPEAALRESGLSEFLGANKPNEPLDKWSAKDRAAKVWSPLCDDLAKKP